MRLFGSGIGVGFSENEKRFSGFSLQPIGPIASPINSKHLKELLNGWILHPAQLSYGHVLLPLYSAMAVPPKRVRRRGWTIVPR